MKTLYVEQNFPKVHIGVWESGNLANSPLWWRRILRNSYKSPFRPNVVRQNNLLYNRLFFFYVPNNVWSERTFVRVKKYSSPPQRWIGQISTFSDSSMDFQETLLNLQCFHILYGKIYSLWEFQKPPILKVMQNFAPVFIFHGAVWLAHQWETKWCWSITFC